MAKWSANKANWTPTSVADTTNFSDSGYMALQGGSSTQLLYVSEIYMGGLATVQSPMSMIVAHDSTVGATALTGVLNAAVDPATAALAAPPAAFSASTTKPQRSATLQIKQLAFNAFGGVVRWAALEASDRIGILGNTASLGELSLSMLAGVGTAGALSSHFTYEPL
jgi:hypothetical protein